MSQICSGLSPSFLLSSARKTQLVVSSIELKVLGTKHYSGLANAPELVVLDLGSMETTKDP